ncbi:MAG: SDR family oxidoreductase [Acidobacteriota bacterium]|nr:SDR family oxidoreductase [Acidobacteriota bacterium]
MRRVRSALITGGTGGLGGAVTRRFLDDGWRCVVPYAEERQAQALRDEAGGDADAARRLVLVECDLFDLEAVERVAALAEDGAAPLAAVVNLVGGFDSGGRVHETPVERFEQQLRLNLRATYLVCAAAIPAMLTRGAGAIVCVSARAATSPFPGAAGYATAKAGVLAFVDALAGEYTKDGIRANAVLPSVIDTPANRASQPDADFSRWVAPREIASAIAFLCSEESAAVSGAHLPVYGRA